MIAALVLVASLSSPSNIGAHAGAGQASFGRAPLARDRGAVVEGGSPSSPRLALADTPAPDPNAPDHRPTFVEQYLSYQLPAQALPVVRDGQVISFVLGYLLFGICGSLWGPVVAIEGAAFDGDVAATWFLSTLMWSVISSAATFTVVGGALWLALPYLSTMATLNALDRQMKKKGFKAPASVAPGQPAPPPATDQPPPSYAY